MTYCIERSVTRRELLRGAAVGLTAVSAGLPSVSDAQGARYRVAVIGRTGRGNYGHGLDIVWNDVSRSWRWPMRIPKAVPRRPSD